MRLWRVLRERRRGCPASRLLEKNLFWNYLLRDRRGVIRIEDAIDFGKVVILNVFRNRDQIFSPRSRQF